MKSIGLRFVPKIAPTPAAPSKPPEQPQAPVETKPVDRDAEFKKRMNDELDAQIEFERHPDLFDDTPGGWENVLAGFRLRKRTSR